MLPTPSGLLNPRALKPGVGVSSGQVRCLQQGRPWEPCTQGKAGSLQGLGCYSRRGHNSPFPHTRTPSSWNLEGLQALGPLATYISPSLWMQVQEVGTAPWDRVGDSSWHWTQGGASSRPSISLSRPEGWLCSHSISHVVSPVTPHRVSIWGLEEGLGGPGCRVSSPLPGRGPGLLQQHGGQVPGRDTPTAGCQALCHQLPRGQGQVSVLTAQAGHRCVWPLWPGDTAPPLLWTPDPRVRAPKTLRLAQGSASNPGRSEAVGRDFRMGAGLGIKVKVRLDSVFSGPSSWLGIKPGKRLKGGSGLQVRWSLKSAAVVN